MRSGAGLGGCNAFCVDCCLLFCVRSGQIVSCSLVVSCASCCRAQSCQFALILGGGGLSEGNEHVWLFTRRVLLPLVSSSALESTPFVMRCLLPARRLKCKCSVCCGSNSSKLSIQMLFICMSEGPWRASARQVPLSALRRTTGVKKKIHIA